MRVGDYVRLGGGRKVYQVVAVEMMPRRGHDGMVEQFKIDATADHPEAAVRVQDAFEWYTESELTEVRRRR
jgi:hypothetical protein